MLNGGYTYANPDSGASNPNHDPLTESPDHKILFIVGYK